MENPVGRWNVGARKREGPELQTKLKVVVDVGVDAPREKCREGRGPGARPHLHSTGDQWRRALKGQWKGTPRVGGGTRGVGGATKVMLQGRGHGQCQIPKESQIR